MRRGAPLGAPHAVSSETEDDGQGLVQIPQLLGTEPTGGDDEPIGADCGRLFDQYPRQFTLDLDRRSEGARRRRARCRCDEHGAEREQLIGLDYDCEPLAVLLTATPSARRSQPPYLATNQS